MYCSFSFPEAPNLRQTIEAPVLPALLQKLVSDFFFDFSQGNLENLVGNLEGIFRDFF